MKKVHVRAMCGGWESFGGHKGDLLSSQEDKQRRKKGNSAFY